MVIKTCVSGLQCTLLLAWSSKLVCPVCNAPCSSHGHQDLCVRSAMYPALRMDVCMWSAMHHALSMDIKTCVSGLQCTLLSAWTSRLVCPVSVHPALSMDIKTCVYAVCNAPCSQHGHQDLCVAYRLQCTLLLAWISRVVCPVCNAPCSQDGHQDLCVAYGLQCTLLLAWTSRLVCSLRSAMHPALRMDIKTCV